MKVQLKKSLKKSNFLVNLVFHFPIINQHINKIVALLKNLNELKLKLMSHNVNLVLVFVEVIVEV